MLRKYRYTKQEMKEARKVIFLRVVMNRELCETPAEKRALEKELEDALCPSAGY